MQGILQSAYKLRTLKLSAMVIMSVVLVEVTIGLTVNSLAIVTDGLHALFDTFTTVVLFLAVRASLKPADEEHTYGHEKFESIGGFVGGLSLIIVAILIIYEATLRLVTGQSINLGLQYAGFAAIGYTFLADIVRLGIVRKTRTSESSAMRVVFYHTLGDFGSTIVALLGFGLATTGLHFGDSVSSMVLGGFLIYLSVRLVWSSGMELTDTISPEIAEKVKHEIVGTQGVCRLEAFQIRKAGEKSFVNATVQVPDYLNFEEAHQLTSKIESNIKSLLKNCEIVIHAEPCIQQLSTEKLIEKTAASINGVREIHEISTVHTSGKLYVTLHALVDPEISVEKAHEIAQSIENKIEERMPEIEHVTVHMEPYSVSKQKRAVVDAEEINTVIPDFAEKYPQKFRVKGIVTYAAGKKLYINIDCSFAKEVSFKEAHEIASDIEERLRERFAESVVTVHMEPESSNTDEKSQTK